MQLLRKASVDLCIFFGKASVDTCAHLKTRDEVPYSLVVLHHDFSDVLQEDGPVSHDAKDVAIHLQTLAPPDGQAFVVALAKVSRTHHSELVVADVDGA